MYFIVSPVPGLLATKSYVVLTQSCFRSECLGQSLMLALHAVTPTPHKAVTLEEYKKNTTKGLPRTCPSVSSNPSFPLCSLPLTFTLEHPPITEKMDVVALNNAAFCGPGWIACKR